jgi:hypothetical protein
MRHLATVVFLMVSAAGLGAGGLIYRAHTAKPTAQAAPPAAERAAEDKPKAPSPARIAARQGRNKPKFTLGKETTYVTGPLDNDGYVDYETALNEKLGKGVDPQKNANVLLWQALRPEPKRFPMPAEFFRWLKTPEPPRRGEYFLDLSRYAKEELELEAGKPTEEVFSLRSRATQRPWVAKDYPHIAGWLKANEKPLAVVLEATVPGRPRSRHGPGSATGSACLASPRSPTRLTWAGATPSSTPSCSLDDTRSRHCG